MLLNQCLAISLSPTTTSGNQAQQEDNLTRRQPESSSNHHCQQQAAKFDGESTSEQSGKDDSVTNQQNDHHFSPKTRPDSTLFEQLIAQNTASKLNCNLNVDADTNTEDKQEKIQALREALNRVEFAGFVVPSWLLLSGSYNDLHCIKTSWSEGNFKSPAGFKIETIGK